MLVHVPRLEEEFFFGGSRSHSHLFSHKYVCRIYDIYINLKSVHVLSSEMEKNARKADVRYQNAN